MYISGAITKNSNYIKTFRDGEMDAREAFPDYDIINPLVYGEYLEHTQKFDYRDLLMLGLSLLSKCDAIYQLKGWEESKGATAELYLAKALKLEIYTQI